MVLSDQRILANDYKKMKILVLGIDGLGRESLEGLGLSRLAMLIDKGQQANPKADNVVSRGWADIYSGTTAYKSGAFFQIPQVDRGVIRPTQKTGADVVAEHIGCENLLWSRLKDSGLNVGLFGLPTVTTAQQNCIFSFPATGAGQFRNGTNSSTVFPEELSELADFSKPNHGLRIGRGAFMPTSSSLLARWLRDHLSQYFYMLRQVLCRTDVNALILGTRFVTLFYKFRHILTAQDLKGEDLILKDVLLEAAADFDSELIRLIEELSPKHTFIVSDHGLGELKYHVNINELLKAMGCINYAPRIFTMTRSVARWGRDKLKGRKGHYFPLFNFAKSKAFSIGYTDLVYINDARFTGQMMTDEQRYEKAVKLCAQMSEFTDSHALTQFVKFEPMKNVGWTSPRNIDALRIPLPDIRCFLDKGSVNLGRTHGNIVENNNPYFAKEMYKKGFFAEHSGCKTNDAIAAYIGPNTELFSPTRLTDLYGEILRVAEQENC